MTRIRDIQQPLIRPTGIIMASGGNTASDLLTTSGDHTLYTPASGKTLRLLWIYLVSSKDNTLEVLATVKLGATVIYRAYLGTPGIFAHRETVDAGAADDALVLNLDETGQGVCVNWTTTEE